MHILQEISTLFSTAYNLLHNLTSAQLSGLIPYHSLHFSLNSSHTQPLSDLGIYHTYISVTEILFLLVDTVLCLYLNLVP